MILSKVKFLTMLLFLSAGLMFSQTITDLTPEAEYDGREDPRERETVVKNKVEVTVGSDMWDGEKKVAQHVIPLRVTIDNGGETPISIRYNNFKLENTEGHKYSVLPLYEIDVELEELIVDKDIGLIPEPIYDYNNYFIYPLYSPIYSAFETTEYDYIFDPVIQEKYFLWDAMKADLPTEDMRMKALPEGVLDDDGIISGFLYFEDIKPTDDKVVFNFDIVNAETGEKKGIVEVPFFVEK